jgi:hypothetical protein
MRKVIAGLLAALAAAIAAPTMYANVIDDLLGAIDEISAWDPEFAAIAPTAAPASDQQFVAGSQKVTQASGNFQHVRVSAHSEAGGVDPHGSVRVTFDSPAFGGAADVKGDVTCLDVNGTQARVAALLREPRNGNTHVTLIIFDNGNPGPTMGQSPDTAFIGFTSTPPPMTCANFGTTLIGDASGNLVVKDDLP